MRFRTLEIRWHDSKPISTCDFQPLSFKKARPATGQEKNYANQAYRLATGGEDNHVRIWMVHPNIRPSSLLLEADTAAAGALRQPRVEYLATLSRHSAAVNVVRFSPNGELIASAGDDGMIIIWAPSTSPQVATYGSDLNAEDLQYEKEHWKPRTTFRCTTMQVYDLAWSPTGEYIIAGSTDNTARVFSVDGKCVCEIAEHLHYVQGVAWDPLNEYIATQSSDRSMHIYRISTKPGGVFEAHAIGKNTRMPHRHNHSHSRTPSAHGGTSRPRMFRRESTTSDIDSSSAFALDLSDDIQAHGKDGTPLTPATSSVSNTPAFMFPPPPIEASSRRSSFSSNAPGSPSTYSRYGRSPSPMPPLPAIRSLPSPAASWANVKLYGDESYTNFFRRLTFSPDGGLLLTPAGQFEDPSVFAPLSYSKSNEDSTPARGRKGHPSESSSSSTSSVYIYSRANFARPPIAQLPGYKKASVAVRFSPVLYELRPGVTTSNKKADDDTQNHEKEKHQEAKRENPPSAVLDKVADGAMTLDMVGPLHISEQHLINSSSGSNVATFLSSQRSSASLTIASPTPLPAISATNVVASSPALSPMDLRPPTPAESKPSTPIASHSHSHSQPQSHSYSHSNSGGTIAHTASVFALPYRMLFAVVTMDTVTIYDTQQASPLCLLTKLHYDEFTDLSWSPDGQCLILSSRDGYCTLLVFDDILPAHHTQQHTLQLQSIAHHHSVPLSFPSTSHASSSTSQITPAATPSTGNINLPFVVTSPISAPQPVNPKKRSEPPLTLATGSSVEGSENVSYFSMSRNTEALAQNASSSAAPSSEALSGATDKIQEPPKKKRRVALTRVGDLES